MDSFPKNLVGQYLKICSKLTKLDRIVFKRFTNLNEITTELTRLALKFEEAGIFQYTALCYMHIVKCEIFSGNIENQCNTFLKAARSFLRANDLSDSLQFKSKSSEYKEGALRCYNLALQRTPDDSVLKAAIIREMSSLQPLYDETSSFASPAHRIYEMELTANSCLESQDYLSALRQLDDIVDSIYERKKENLYEELLWRVELLRLLLLIGLNLSPVHQSPSHIKLIELYYHLGTFKEFENRAISPTSNWNIACSSAPTQMKYILAELVVSWCEQNQIGMEVAARELATEYSSLHKSHKLVISYILQGLKC